MDLGLPVGKWNPDNTFYLRVQYVCNVWVHMHYCYVNAKTGWRPCVKVTERSGATQKETEQPSVPHSAQQWSSCHPHKHIQSPPKYTSCNHRFTCYTLCICKMPPIWLCPQSQMWYSHGKDNLSKLVSHQKMLTLLKLSFFLFGYWSKVAGLLYSHYLHKIPSVP